VTLASAFRKLGIPALAFPVLLLLGQSTKQPTFADYKVKERWGRSNRVAQLKTATDREYRTRILTASKQPANFAGQYQFVIWGCGSNCVMGAVIDLASGIVCPPPRSVENGAGVIDLWPISANAVEFKVDSRLVILHGHRPGTGIRDVFYYEWRDRQFHLLQRVAVQEPE